MRAKTDSKAGSKATSKGLWLYGLHPVKAALRFGSKYIETLCLAEQLGERQRDEIMSLAKKNQVGVRWVDRGWFDERFPDIPHQKVAALYQQPPAKDMAWLQAQLRKPDSSEESAKHSLILVLDGVQDPQNFGACLRVAESLGVLAIVQSKTGQASLTAAAHKAAAGAAVLVPIVEVTNLARALRELKDAGSWIYGAAGDTELSLKDIDFATSSVVVMGAEGQGLRANTREHCDQVFAIPMYGETESLNVSVATGIVLHTIRTQWG